MMLTLTSQLLDHGLAASPSLSERLQRVSLKMTYLGRKLLPSLGAVRYALRHADEAAIRRVSKLAKESSVGGGGICCVIAH